MTQSWSLDDWISNAGVMTRTYSIGNGEPDTAMKITGYGTVSITDETITVSGFTFDCNDSHTPAPSSGETTITLGARMALAWARTQLSEALR